MRVSFLVSLTLATTPCLAFAGDGDHHGGHGGHHGGHGGGHGGGGGGTGGGGGGGGGQPVATVAGAGQRLSFSFGGRIRLQGNKATGDFALVAHPLAPQGTTISVACRYKKFDQVTITGNSAVFRGMGKCTRLLNTGALESFDATNVFQIVDNPDGDAIDVNFVGPTGIAVPGGSLEFGDFTVTPAV